MTAGRGNALAAALALGGALSCIPDMGDRMEAGVDRPRAESALPPADASGADQSPGADGQPPPDGPTVTCGTPDRTIELEAGQFVYTPDAVTAKAGDCIELCVTSTDSHFHTHQSAELFDDFTTNPGKRLCVVFKRRLEARTYGIVCSEHVGLNMRATIKGE